MVSKSQEPKRNAADLIPLHDSTRYCLGALIETNPLYAYALIKRVSELSEGLITPREGNISVSLRRWAGMGLIERLGEAEKGKSRGRERILYSITDFGRDVFDLDLIHQDCTVRKLKKIASGNPRP